MRQSVAAIDHETAEEISGLEYFEGVLFNPIKDADDNTIISLQEAQYLDLSKWEVIEFNPKIEENENIQYQ